jgi:DNA-binding transcriptional LysR family regulator
MSRLICLRSFLSVYRYNSISKAAGALHLTQPAVSRHIKILESHLGCKLFDRLPRGLAATKAASELERRVAPHLDSLEAALERAGGTGKTVAGVLRVGSTRGLTKLVFSSLATLAEHGIVLELRFAPSPGLLTGLADRQFDLAVTPWRIPHKAIEYDVIYEGPVVLVCSPRWRERLPRTSAPHGLPLIDVEGPASMLATYWRATFDRNPDSASAIVPDHQAAIEAAVAGIGLAVVPECLCADRLLSGQLIIHKPGTKLQTSLYAAYNKATSAGDRIRIARQLLSEAARNGF